jgi:hypothetical protein
MVAMFLFVLTVLEIDMAKYFITILITIILGLGTAAHWLYGQNEILKSNNDKLETAIEEQKEAIKVMKESFELQANALSNLQRANAAIEAEKDRYLDIFRRHNLDRLALMKPGLIETRINNGTAEILEVLENDSKNISNLNPNNSN